MQNNVLAKETSPNIRAYVVWVPMFRGLERDVPKAAREVRDGRASHYWDGDSQLVKGYRQTLGTTEDAWDIFLLYGPEAKWEGDQPPKPLYWMHQLGSAKRPRLAAPFLDAGLFLNRTRELVLSTTPPA